MKSRNRIPDLFRKRRESSVRSAMFIVKPPHRISQAPLGAACGFKPIHNRTMPLLTELGTYSGRVRFYKHGAPNGAFGGVL